MDLNPKLWFRACEDWWFDRSRHVETSGLAKPGSSNVIGEVLDSKIYSPARTANAHTAIRDLPIGDFSQYTFIDMGSGKGRALFIAAEYPFQKVLGVEYSMEIQRLALENIRSFRHPKQRCMKIESIAANAAEYQFPDGNLVLFLFNPFGPEIMRRMLANLGRSLAEKPRHAVIVMLWPEHAQTVAEMPGIRPYRQSRRYHIYETGSVGSA
jgi:SAM-dependent methyltransferase